MIRLVEWWVAYSFLSNFLTLHFLIFLPFLSIGVKSASFKQDGNINDFIKPLIKEHKTFPNISEFSLMIWVGISEFWDALLLFKFNISYCVSSIETSLKQKFICTFYRSWTARILGWYLCFRIALIVRFSTLSIDGSNSLYFRIIRFLITFPKKIFRVSAVSSSALTTSPFSIKCIQSLITILSENEGFIVFQKSLLSINFLSFS